MDIASPPADSDFLGFSDWRGPVCIQPEPPQVLFFEKSRMRISVGVGKINAQYRFY
jgi:hypothetical protein